jgi:hypothetical protein
LELLGYGHDGRWQVNAKTADVITLIFLYAPPEMAASHNG